MVTDLLVDHFGNLVDLEFTARMEDELDEVANGSRAWRPVVRDFYTPFRSLVDSKTKELRRSDFTRRASDEVSRLVPTPGSYVSESDFFIADWQEAFWGSNYPRLVAVKRKYDPTGLFFAHHGVGSEEWQADGFTKLAEDDAG